MRTLVVIPARGGSRGVPRKNLRPLGGKPLLAWAIGASKAAAGVDRVVVSTDSEEIAVIAERFGAQSHRRDPLLAGDLVTLDPVIYEAAAALDPEGTAFDIVATIQPTSPLLRPATIEAVLDRLRDPGLDSVLTVVDDTHLGWVDGPDGLVPDFSQRLNRQQLPRRYRETGAVLATRRSLVRPDSRLGEKVGVLELDRFEGIDIDTPDDWLVAEAALQRRRIAFVVVGNRRQGMGHVRRVQTLVEALSAHHCRIFCDPEQDLAVAHFENAFFPIEVVDRSRLLELLVAWGAQVVVHDELDTDAADLAAEKRAGMRVVCLEDGGGGLDQADAVLNALHPERLSDPAAGRLSGPQVYCLREEFRSATRRPFHASAERALVTFGGTDPSNLTGRVLEAIGPDCPVALTVVAGMGVEDREGLESLCARLREGGTDVELLHEVELMSEVMSRADLAFSSAGRTLYELAFMGVPTLVLVQNEQETRHEFALGPGFTHLGFGAEAEPELIRSAFLELVNDTEARRRQRETLLACDLTSGRDRVVRVILESP